MDLRDRSIDCAALSMNPSIAQASINRESIDRSHCSNDGWSRASIDACTVRYEITELKPNGYDFDD